MKLFDLQHLLRREISSWTCGFAPNQIPRDHVDFFLGEFGPEMCKEHELDLAEMTAVLIELHETNLDLTAFNNAFAIPA